MAQVQSLVGELRSYKLRGMAKKKKKKVLGKVPLWFLKSAREPGRCDII